MKTHVAIAALALLVSASATLAQDADRAAARTDSNRANVETRANALGGSPTIQQETIVKERVITVPAKKRVQSPAQPAVQSLVQSAAQLSQPVSKPQTKRVFVRETVEKTVVPTRQVNPF